jgi:hypothetical protein
MDSPSLYFIDYQLPIVLQVDASLTGVGSVLFNFSGSEQRIIQFLSHKFSPPAQRWSTFEQEGYAIYWSILKLQHLLLGHPFTLQTDHRNLLWMEKAAAPKVIRWRLRLQEFDFSIVHIPGKSNIFADYLSRLEAKDIDISVPDPGDLIRQVHNSIRGHHGSVRTVKLLLEAGHNWSSMKKDVQAFVQSCPLCQKIRDMNHKFSKHFGKLPYYAPGEAIFSDGLGPFPLDSFGNEYVIVNISSGDHFISLHAVPSLDSQHTVHSLLRDFSNHGCPRIFWSDQGSNYTSKVLEQFCALFTIDQKFSLPYRPQANSIVERSHRETLKHLRAILSSVSLRDSWSLAIPMVQWIFNTSYIHDMGTTPMRLRFGDSMDISRGFLSIRDSFQSTEQYIEHLNKQFLDVISSFQTHSPRLNNSPSDSREDIQIGDYVLVSYPHSAPSKLHAPFRGPMLVLEPIRDEGFLCQDIITQSQLQVTHSRLKKFHPPQNFSPDDYINLARSDHDEYVVESILAHQGDPKKKKSLLFKIKWKGYDTSECTWEPWSHVRNLAALDVYLNLHPELRLPRLPSLGPPLRN